MKTILCVDDEPDLLKSLATSLENNVDGVFVECCGSVEEAIEYLTTERDNVSLIISDQIMPGMKGIELLRYCSFMYPNIPSVLLTGYADMNRVRYSRDRMPNLTLFDKPWGDDLYVYVKSVIKNA